MKQILSGNRWEGRSGFKPKFIILHGTAGGERAEDIAHYFQSSSVSAHYVIGKAGEIVQCVPEEDSAWANGVVKYGADRWWWDGPNPNLISISIEHCKPNTDNSDSLTPEQQRSSFQLIKEISERWKIPKKLADKDGGITGHFSLDPINRKHCPGPYPWNQLFTYLEEDEMIDITHPFVAAHFKDVGGGRWECVTTRVSMFGGILNYWRQINGAPRLPITNEKYDIPGVAYQIFESGIIVYDPQNKLDAPPGFAPCYLAKLNSPLCQSLFTRTLYDLDPQAVQPLLTALLPFVTLSDQLKKVIT